MYCQFYSQNHSSLLMSWISEIWLHHCWIPAEIWILIITTAECSCIMSLVFDGNLKNSSFLQFARNVLLRKTGRNNPLFAFFSDRCNFALCVSYFILDTLLFYKTLLTGNVSKSFYSGISFLLFLAKITIFRRYKKA